VHGHPSHEADLLRAGLKTAECAIILADESLSPWDADAKTILRTLAVKSVNPACYVCVEVLKSENRRHFEHTHADELIVSGEITGALLASAAVTHGISHVVNHLLTHPEGNEFYAVRPPPTCVGRSIADVLTSLKRDHNSILVGISDGTGSYSVNPPNERVVNGADMLLVIAEDDRSITSTQS
jgi:voltage-gated potassium channel